MPNLVTFSTINEKTKKYRSDYLLDDMSTAFEWLCLEAILNLNEDEIEDAITDGQLDGGVDAIHITGRDVHIFNFKYTELFKNSKKNFPANEIDKILVTMAGIYSKSLKKGDVNDLVWEKVEEIWDLFKKGLSISSIICALTKRNRRITQRKDLSEILISINMSNTITTIRTILFQEYLKRSTERLTEK